MEWWILAVIGITAVLLVIDWFIVMGTNSKEWKSNKYNKRR